MISASVDVDKIIFFYMVCNFALLIHVMGVWKQISEYLYLRKPDPDRPNSQWVKYMHGINRISILIFIFCLIVLAVKLLTK